MSGVLAVIPSRQAVILSRQAVILSAGAEALSVAKGKDLCVHRARPFAEFTLERSEGLRVTGIISKCLPGESHIRGASFAAAAVLPVNPVRVSLE